MLIVLPGPAAFRVKSVMTNAQSITATFVVRDKAAGDALVELLLKAYREGYGIELRLLHYEGQPDAVEQGKERRRRKETGEKLVVKEE